jgi:DNA-binding CsgD family transcriptional regulator/tetratricopeptide (TPR) repeat protein
MGTGQASAGPLLDRTAELEVIAAAVTAARDGSGTALVVEGEAGIGKTRLLAHASLQAREAGMTVLAARAAEFEGGYAWGIARQLFAPAVLSEAADWMASGTLALAAPALIQGAYRGEEDAFAVVHGLYWLIARLAERSPLLVAVDDLHWADQPSQRFVAHLARRLEGLPVLLIVTIREPRSGTAQEKAPTTALAADENVAVLRPAALGPKACATMATSALGDAVSPAFAAACREITGGNPWLLHAVLGGLAAENAQGTDADVARLRRLTPAAVSRNVLLQLGRMPGAALAAARSIAVLGTAATTDRAARLAGLDADVCADAVAGLMAERLVEGDRALQFVHPLVRSVVYEDLAPPVRQRWHSRAAHMLDGDGAALEEVTVHLLASGQAGDPWVVGTLRRAADDARARGAGDVAVLCLRRAVAEPPPAHLRGEVLFELGAAELAQAPAEACAHLTEALAGTRGTRRSQVALTLGEALALSGRFTDAVHVLQTAITEQDDDDCSTRDALEAALLNIARWDLGTRPLTGPVLERLSTRSENGELLNPQLHANLAIELAAAGTDRERAVDHARAAVQAMPELMSVTATALPEAISVLLFADLANEAQARSQAWLRLAQERGWPLASAVAATSAALTAMWTGDISEALAFGDQAAAGPGWLPVITVGFMLRALIDRGAIDQAHSLLVEHHLARDLGPIWPFNVVRHARGCLYAATGDHAAAAADLLAAGELARRWGIINPAMMPWRSDAALSLHRLGRQQQARQLCAEEISLARRWGAGRATGIALRAAALVGDADRRIEQLIEAVAMLRDSPARLELARALIDLGAAWRRAGSTSRARECLREGLDHAYAAGGLMLTGRARDELVAVGARPRRNTVRGRDALTASELRVAQLATSGRTNAQIAQALFVTRRTVENHLTSSYGKLGIRSRAQLHQALREADALAAD